MKKTGYILLLATLLFLYVSYNKSIASDGFTAGCELTQSDYENLTLNAINDTFHMVAGCQNVSISGNFLRNDIVEEGFEICVKRAFAPSSGIFSCGPHGNFIYKWDDAFYGELVARYEVCFKDAPEVYAEGLITIIIHEDFDCDGIKDLDDLDDDNDGISDLDEMQFELDMDGDGLPNHTDIDADNDGIPDNVEWQAEKLFILPLEMDLNQNGWDDAYDIYAGGSYHESHDTDKDGYPDFIDNDSDDDRITDLIEGNVLSGSAKALVLMNSDADNDGLDDIFDCICKNERKMNATGSNSILPDSNEDGVRDWRDALNFKDNFIIYPNPAQTGTTVVYKTKEYMNKMYSIKVFNQSAFLVYTSDNLIGAAHINVNQIPEGLYYVQISCEHSTETKKLLVRR